MTVSPVVLPLHKLDDYDALPDPQEPMTDSPDQVANKAAEWDARPLGQQLTQGIGGAMLERVAFEPGSFVDVEFGTADTVVKGGGVEFPIFLVTARVA